MSKLVMVVDDDDMMLNLIEIMLRRFGVSIIKATDGETALDLLERVKPDLFVLDVMMPGIDGFELSSVIRTRPETAHLPIIILSALGDPTSIAKGRAAGANAYVSKINLYAELPATIQEFLNTDRSNLL